MRRSAFYGMLFTFLCLPGLYGQYVYPERFENCYLDEFKYEETRIIAEIDNEKLKSVITSGWDDKMLKKAEGFVGLQILVDRKGGSCLMSVRNDTNMKLKKMNLEANVNENLKWKGQSDKISAIVLLEFKDGEIVVKRLGTTDMRNLVEIH
ncbi:hypothetical protein [Roseivirga sp. UBA1976]|uniref:hypothetical protein n=1 Tax=Roseivirga sp. UBA1976 TaxID=1947386 RepID=UPI00257C6ADE|nr:hypothetical protein [Roseivirga sp. UBA1976]|tara:strand:- start:1693 stop:2145 length:453 start_codon:yes stop_codon:yes gene_type:complete